MALAMGMEMATARLGTMLALAVTVPIATSLVLLMMRVCSILIFLLHCCCALLCFVLVR